VRFKKADAQIRIIITIGNILKIENLSLKKANSDADYNQIDKRTVDDIKKCGILMMKLHFGLNFLQEN